MLQVLHATRVGESNGRAGRSAPSAVCNHNAQYSHS
jgi:hypothetical protein